MYNHKEENLTEALTRQSSQAYHDAYKLYFKKVRMQAFLKLKNHADADDIAQEVFRSLLEKGGNLKIEKSLENYLVIIARNKAVDVLKTRTHHQNYIDRTAPTLPVMVDAISHQLENKEFMENVHLGLTKINSKLVRDVFKHYYLEGMNHKEVAALLDISVYNSRTSVNRAINSLRDFFKNLD